MVAVRVEAAGAVMVVAAINPHGCEKHRQSLTMTPVQMIVPPTLPDIGKVLWPTGLEGDTC